MRAFNALTSTLWAMEPSMLRTMASISLRQNEDWESLAAKRGLRVKNTRSVEMRGAVAVIPLSGPLFPKANLMEEMSGATSLEMFSLDLHEALNNEAVDHIVIDIDSPGGVASGIGEMAEMIRQANAIKPITAYVSGTAASAAYWLASAAGEIVAHKTARLGSIGVVVGVPVQEDTDNNGERIIEIVSSNAAEKRPDPRTDEGKASILRQIDALEAEFHGDIAAFRGVSVDKVKTEFGRGGVFIAGEAVRVGMADRLGSFEDLIAELSGSPQTSQKGDYHMTAKTKADPAVQETGITEADLEAARKEGHEAGFAEGQKAGLASGAEAERARILGIESVAMAGHEDLIAAAKADGTSTAEQVAVKIVAAQKQLGGNYLTDLKQAAASTPEIEPRTDDQHAPSGEDHTLSLEDRAKAKWNKDANLRAEFRSFDTYVGYLKGEEEGRFRIKK